MRQKLIKVEGEKDLQLCYLRYPEIREAKTPKKKKNWKNGYRHYKYMNVVWVDN
jgi:hypothetical protein